MKKCLHINLTMCMLAVIVGLPVSAQSDAIDIDNVPPQWVWKLGKYPAQVKACNPIQQELNRILQPLPNGVHATYFLAFGDRPVMGPGTPKYYDASVMIKKFEFNSLRKIIEPEGETGCWLHFQMNTLEGRSYVLPGMLDKVRYGPEEQFIYMCKVQMEKDANGNHLLYTSSYGREQVREGYFFSQDGKIPIRKLSKKEWFDAYFMHHSKDLEQIIAKYEKSIATDEKKYIEMSDAQKKEESYWPELLARNKKELAQYRSQLALLKTWYQQQQTRKDLQEPAMVDHRYSTDYSMLDSKEGYPLWVSDASFFNKNKSPDIPQFIFLRIRPVDAQVPKKRFMDRFRTAFNLDVLNQIVGIPPKKPESVNTVEASVSGAKTETAAGQRNNSLNNSFSTEPMGGFPKSWNGMKDATLQEVSGQRWLQMSKPGYCYPRQFNKTIEDGFLLAFDLSWNKEIDYYTGPFSVQLASLEYDNATEGFNTSSKGITINALYDSYTPGFHRIVLRFDPHFNDAGQLQVLVQDPSGVNRSDKKINLPLFYKDKNKHRIEVLRVNNSLKVLDNDILIATVDDAFLPMVKYNVFVFSRFRANNDKPGDYYLIKEIEVKYK